MDVHRDFCEVAVAENGRVRSAGSIQTRVPALELFAQSLAPDDTSSRSKRRPGSDRILSVLQRHGIRVVVANTRKLKAITDAKAKTDSSSRPPDNGAEGQLAGRGCAAVAPEVTGDSLCGVCFYAQRWQPLTALGPTTMILARPGAGVTSEAERRIVGLDAWDAGA
jgi:hypothetical protein